MAGNQAQPKSSGQVVESVTPEQVHKADNKASRNPLKSWFKSSGASSDASTTSKCSSNSEGSGSSTKAKQKPPLVVHYFPTANRPSLR